MDFDSTLENDSRLRAELGGLLKIALNLPLKNSSFHKIICKLCKESDFQIYRYKCLICEDYNLCGDCFEKKQQDTEHKLEHPVVRFETPNELFGLKFDDTEINLLNFIELFQTTRHSGFKCDGCLMNPIQGIRFKCDQCHEFDLCLDCYWDKKSTLKHSYSQHTLIALGKNANLEIDPSNIELLRELGSGAFGSVYKSRLRNLNKIVACKIIQIDKLNNNNNSQDKTVLYESYLHELNAYKELKGVNILKMFGHCVEKVNNTKSNLMIITEFMSRGSLTTLLNNDPNITYRRRLQIATDIACGMARIHEHGFIHRDIRADNILIAEDFTAKIGDMGIAKLIENNKNTMIGCRPFMPPEFYTGMGILYSYLLNLV